MDRSPEVTSRLLLQHAPWDALDTEYEKRIPFDSPSEWRDTLHRQCLSGEASHCRILENGERVGLFVYKVDEGRARELVLVAAYCDGTASLSRDLGRAADVLARQLGCVSIRFHTVRPALARIAAHEFGYRLSEIVLRKNVLQ